MIIQYDPSFASLEAELAKERIPSKLETPVDCYNAIIGVYDELVERRQKPLEPYNAGIDKPEFEVKNRLSNQNVLYRQSALMGRVGKYCESYCHPGFKVQSVRMSLAAKLLRAHLLLEESDLIYHAKNHISPVILREAVFTDKPNTPLKYFSHDVLEPIPCLENQLRKEVRAAQGLSGLVRGAARTARNTVGVSVAVAIGFYSFGFCVQTLAFNLAHVEKTTITAISLSSFIGAAYLASTKNYFYRFLSGIGGAILSLGGLGIIETLMHGDFPVTLKSQTDLVMETIGPAAITSGAAGLVALTDACCDYYDATRSEKGSFCRLNEIITTLTPATLPDGSRYIPPGFLQGPENHGALGHCQPAEAELIRDWDSSSPQGVKRP